MANRYSSYPSKLDKLKILPEFQEMSVQQWKSFAKWNEITSKGSNITQSDINELNALLKNDLRDVQITSTDWNLLCGSVMNLEDYIVNHIFPDISKMVNDKENEFIAVINNKTKEITNFVNTKQQEIKNYADTTITHMEEKKVYFSRYVDTKEDEVRDLVQEFDTRTARYYQVWKSTERQQDYNIFDKNASNQTLPPEANLNIAEENIDLTVNGTTMTPYVDFYIKKDGKFNTIVLTDKNATLIDAGTEIVAKWFKNVGKLYFRHAQTHEAGGSDPIHVTSGMLDEELKKKIPTVSNVAPSSPLINQIWIDIN